MASPNSSAAAHVVDHEFEAKPSSPSPSPSPTRTSTASAEATTTSSPTPSVHSSASSEHNLSTAATAGSSEPPDPTSLSQITEPQVESAASDTGSTTDPSTSTPQITQETLEADLAGIQADRFTVDTPDRTAGTLQPGLDLTVAPLASASLPTSTNESFPEQAGPTLNNTETQNHRTSTTTLVLPSSHPEQDSSDLTAATSADTPISTDQVVQEQAGHIVNSTETQDRTPITTASNFSSSQTEQESSDLTAATSAATSTSSDHIIEEQTGHIVSSTETQDRTPTNASNFSPSHSEQESSDLTTATSADTPTSTDNIIEEQEKAGQTVISTETQDHIAAATSDLPSSETEQDSSDLTATSVASTADTPTSTDRTIQEQEKAGQTANSTETLDDTTSTFLLANTQRGSFDLTRADAIIARNALAAATEATQEQTETPLQTNVASTDNGIGSTTGLGITRPSTPTAARTSATDESEDEGFFTPPQVRSRAASPLSPRLRRVAPSGHLPALVQEPEEAPQGVVDPNDVAVALAGGHANANNALAVMGEEEEFAAADDGMFDEEVEEEDVESDGEGDDDDDDEEGVLFNPNADQGGPGLDRLQAGFAHLEEVRVEIDALDREPPAQFGRGDPAAVRARANLVHAVAEIRGAFGEVAAALQREREAANAAEETLRPLRAAAPVLAARLRAAEIEVGVARARALALARDLEEARSE